MSTNYRIERISSARNRFRLTPTMASRRSAAGQLSYHRHADVERAVLRDGIWLREEGGGDGQSRSGRARRRVADAIIAACDRLIAGEMRDQFITDFIQGGAGTSTNMNANEVIANLALEQLGHKKGEYQYVNPNDHVNFGQSTNDVYPTAFRLALILRLSSYMEALRKLQSAFFAKGKEFERVLKMGRTHLQDAVPMSLGQEFHGWGTTIGEEVERIAEVRQFLHEINLGATAIGTTVTAPGYPELATKYLSELTDCKFILGGDLVEATSDTGAYVLLSGVPQAHVDQADQDLQRHPPVWLRTALRLQRDQPAADAAGQLDHAGQGQSGDPGSREPDELPRHRPRPHGDARRVGRPACSSTSWSR